MTPALQERTQQREWVYLLEQSLSCNSEDVSYCPQGVPVSSGCWNENTADRATYNNRLCSSRPWRREVHDPGVW